MNSLQVFEVFEVFCLCATLLRSRVFLFIVNLHYLVLTRLALLLVNTQVYLFGSTYDAGKVWNSTKWDQHLPTVSLCNALFYTYSQ